MQSVDQIATEIVRREGGFVNDPDDPGGATKYGVTIHTLRRLGLDLDQDGDIDVQDVRRITIERAVEIYKEHYFHRPGIAQLPEAVQASMFDMYVNAGANAVKILQRLLVRFGLKVSVDGRIGPQTIAATARGLEIAPLHLSDAYGIARRNYYYELADRRVKSRKYARRRDGGKGGWIKRAEEFISPKFHLSEAEHKKRVSQWA